MNAERAFVSRAACETAARVEHAALASAVVGTYGAHELDYSLRIELRCTPVVPLRGV